MRTETESLGEFPVPRDALYGIHTARAMVNFPLSGQPCAPALIRALSLVKLACAQTNAELGYLEAGIADAIAQACHELAEGQHRDAVLVDALQGGAGTSLNMNVNEVIANRAVEILGGKRGDYRRVHPLHHVNLHQSTNDVFPTALKIAAIESLHQLEKAITALQMAVQSKENEFTGILKVGRTQLQDACQMTLGAELSAWAEALGRDRWRVFKCEERLRVVNLGGTAIGTGLTAPRDYIFRVCEKLRDVTRLGLARAENLVDATQNADVFVEVSGILKAHAVNLFKISSDLRLLGNLGLLERTCTMFRERCIEGLQANAERCRELLENSHAQVTALVPTLGYELAADIAREAQQSGQTVRSIVLARGLVAESVLDRLLSANVMTALGYSKKQ